MPDGLGPTAYSRHVIILVWLGCRCLDLPLLVEEGNPVDSVSGELPLLDNVLVGRLSLLRQDLLDPLSRRIVLARAGGVLDRHFVLHGLVPSLIILFDFVLQASSLSLAHLAALLRPGVLTQSELHLLLLLLSVKRAGLVV